MATEQKTKWTPGPWTSDGVVFSGPDGMIGECGFGLRGDGEMEANARLIAASPTLVEAVRKAITYINGETNGYADDDEQQSARCVLDDLRYALAQATGEGWE